MTRVRSLMLLGVLALILALVPVAAAQETYGLSAEDYALLTTANENSSLSSSYEYAFTLTLDASTAGDSVNIALDGSGAMSDGFSMNVGGSMTASGDVVPVQLGVMVVSDTLYISLDNGETWYSATPEELSSMGSSMMGGMLPVDPAELASGDLSGLESQMGGMGDMMTGMEGIDPTSFMSMASAPAADGNVEFTLTIDIATLLSTPEMSQLLGMALMSSGEMGTGTEAPSAEEMQMMGAMIGGMFADANATLVQVIDPATELVQQTTISFGLPLDAMGSAGDGVNVVFDINLSNYDATAPVVAPASSQPLESMLSGMMGGM